jgi:hypothetical protein
MTKGWKFEGIRHGLAARGIKTGRKGKTFLGIATMKPKEVAKARKEYFERQAK